MIKRINNTKGNVLQEEAFLFYYALGSNRTLDLVAKEFGRSEIAVKIWSGKFNWTERVREKEVAEHKKAREELTEGLDEVKERSQRIIKKLLDKAEEDLKEGLIKIKNTYDINLAIKSELLLLGEVTEREEKKIVFVDVKGREAKKDGGDRDTEDRKVLRFPQRP